ncbi:unnamed protein product [Protopolystoma xenopodis]|uniref:Uncharacterized protein n=1 Tax=Protopolystoma xenopodis TaxID=117903 RepID=A0A448WN64_9PLAT|nr:unnamed protein product [Protopolystoma xenopodis]
MPRTQSPIIRTVTPIFTNCSSKPTQVVSDAEETMATMTSTTQLVSRLGEAQREIARLSDELAEVGRHTRRPEVIGQEGEVEESEEAHRQANEVTQLEDPQSLKNGLAQPAHNLLHGGTLPSILGHIGHTTR